MSVQPFEKTRHTFISPCGTFIYHLAIIDYLQDYNIDKQMENKFKSILNRETENLISAVKPEPYQKRFIEFMRKEVIVD